MIEKAHKLSGHFGVRRTTHLVIQSYWWQGIVKDVAVTVASCRVCGEVKAQFNTQKPVLTPLPIMGILYRWHVDLMGPFPMTDGGMRYGMIMIDSGSKNLILWPLPAKEAKYTATAFEICVLARFGSCAEVVTDGGGE